MIAEPYILHWRDSFPWAKMHNVEQDLLISRAVVAIYSDEFLATRLAWRGGTALYKLHLKPQARYSEDIDLVLINPEPMGRFLIACAKFCHLCRTCRRRERDTATC